MSQSRIVAGLQRLATFQHDDGLYSIWCGGRPGLDITGRVAHRLLGLRGLPFPEAESMLNRADAALRKRGYRDNALLPLSSAYEQPLETVEDAVAYYFAGNGRRAEALAFLRRTAQRRGNRVSWPARRAWGGSLQVTADAARVMYHARDPLFRPAFTTVTASMIDGRLYSTADTRALVDLLAALDFETAEAAIIDGRKVRLAETAIGRQVTALSDNLIVRVDEQREIDHLAPRADFQFSVEIGKRRLSLGERTQITITPQEQTIAPLTRLFLPGNLALLKGGANAQTAYLPVEQQALVVDVVAVRTGWGKLYVAVNDMYDAEKVGTSPGLEIAVS